MWSIMYPWPMSTGPNASLKLTRAIVSSRDQPFATASATAAFQSSRFARWTARYDLDTTGPWPGQIQSTSRVRIRSSAASHWSTSEVISQVWHSEKIVSPVNTTRSSGTWTASWPGVWPGVWSRLNVWSPTCSVRSPVNTIVPLFGSR